MNDIKDKQTFRSRKMYSERRKDKEGVDIGMVYYDHVQQRYTSDR